MKDAFVCPLLPLPIIIILLHGVVLGVSQLPACHLWPWKVNLWATDAVISPSVLPTTAPLKLCKCLSETAFMLLLYNLTLTKKNYMIQPSHLIFASHSCALSLSCSLLLLTWSSINMLTFQRRITHWQFMVMPLKLTSYLHPYRLILFSHLVLLFSSCLASSLWACSWWKYEATNLILTHLSQYLLSFYFWYNI